MPPDAYYYKIIDPQKALKIPYALLDYRTCVDLDFYYGYAIFWVKILEEYGLKIEEA